jgi:hypothetical protein
MFSSTTGSLFEWFTHVCVIGRADNKNRLFFDSWPMAGLRSRWGCTPSTRSTSEWMVRLLCPPGILFGILFSDNQYPCSDHYADDVPRNGTSIQSSYIPYAYDVVEHVHPGQPNRSYTVCGIYYIAVMGVPTQRAECFI